MRFVTAFEPGTVYFEGRPQHRRYTAVESVTARNLKTCVVDRATGAVPPIYQTISYGTRMTPCFYEINFFSHVMGRSRPRSRPDLWPVPQKIWDEDPSSRKNRGRPDEVVTRHHNRKCTQIFVKKSVTEEETSTRTRRWPSGIACYGRSQTRTRTTPCPPLPRVMVDGREQERGLFLVLFPNHNN